MTDRAGVRAIVWRRGDTPPDLIAALDRQGIEWEPAGGPYEALSRVLACRARSARARVLLLVEPDGLEMVEEVRRAIERFDPATGCWVYRQGASPRLAPFAQRAEVPELEVVVRPQPPGRGAPDLRLAGHGGGGPAEATAPAEAEPAQPRSLLTPEELAMLLADDPPGRANPPRRGRGSER